MKQVKVAVDSEWSLEKSCTKSGRVRPASQQFETRPHTDALEVLSA